MFRPKRKRSWRSSASSSGRLRREAADRRRLVATLIETVWQDNGVVVAVKPRDPFLRYFKGADELAQRRARNRAAISGSDGTRTRDCHPIEIRE